MTPRRAHIKKCRWTWRAALKHGVISSETLYSMVGKRGGTYSRFWLNMLLQHRFRQSLNMDAWVNFRYEPAVRVIAIDEAVLWSGPEVPS